MKSQAKPRHAGFFALFGAASLAADAVRDGQAPRRRDLRTLGIDPTAFERIGR